MIDLSTDQIFYLVAAAAFIGFTKTSVGGVGILAVLLLALAFPGKASPGIMLPMAFFADIMAVLYYRRDCQWEIILKLMPLTAVGVVIGYLIFDILPSAIFERILGIIIFAMLGMSLMLERSKGDIRKNRLVAAVTGIIAGVTSMIANAAGPVFSIYLLQMGLDKKEFVGTRSWFYLVINMIKIPFSIHLGLITSQSLTLNIMTIPVILVGAAIGVKVLNMLNLNLFKWLVRAAIVIAAIRLVFF